MVRDLLVALLRIAGAFLGAIVLIEGMERISLVDRLRL